MSDIVDRLRDWPRMTPVACKEAADEIERLRGLLDAKGTPGYEMLASIIQERDAEIERLRTALEEIARAAREEFEHYQIEGYEGGMKLHQIAAAALEPR